MTGAGDPDTERVVRDELTSLLGDDHVRAARIVIVRVADGSVAVADGQDGAGPRPSLATDDVRSHGSAGKTFTIAAALDRGTVTTQTTLSGDPLVRGAITITDHETHGAMSLEDVMAFSSNVGTTRIADDLGSDALFAAYERFGLGVRIPSAIRGDDAMTARFAYGADLAATSVEVARAYAIVARGGTDASGRTVISEEAAATTMALLESSVTRPDGTGRRAAIEGVRVAGKTGTMPVEGGTFGVFVGIVPADAPRFVVLVGIETTSDAYSGGTIAAPAFARVARSIW